MKVVKVESWRNEEEKLKWLSEKVLRVEKEINEFESKPTNEFNRSQINYLKGKKNGMELAMLCLGYELEVE